jgi:hypothetical protein
MIDTIVLSLTPEIYQISGPDKFKPSASWILANQNKEARLRYCSIISKQNATKKELLKGYTNCISLWHAAETFKASLNHY